MSVLPEYQSFVKEELPSYREEASYFKIAKRKHFSFKGKEYGIYNKEKNSKDYKVHQLKRSLKLKGKNNELLIELFQLPQIENSYSFLISNQDNVNAVMIRNNTDRMGNYNIIINRYDVPMFSKMYGFVKTDSNNESLICYKIVNLDDGYVLGKFVICVSMNQLVELGFYMSIDELDVKILLLGIAQCYSNAI
ncbi:hypothetical protein K502DRAFT_160955 [Neoconidiobolus thromboides FSU 785]|nr:hypothetical protein K502DRAFT_160955 [Neoconidiobolus thromboides FSU 785]